MQVIGQNIENNRTKQASYLPKKFKSSIKNMQVTDQKMLVIDQKKVLSSTRKVKVNDQKYASLWRK